MKHSTSCPICASTRLYYAFSVLRYRLLECRECSYLTMFPQPSSTELAEINGHEISQQRFSMLSRATGSRYLDLIRRYRGKDGGRLLEVGCGGGELLLEAITRGYQVTGVESSASGCAAARANLGANAEIVQGEINAVAGRARSYDVCVLSEVIEHVRDPRSFLTQIHEILAPGGVVLIATPSLDSWPARLMKGRWMEFKAEHLHYFNQNTLHSLLFQSGYERILPAKAIKTLSLAYITDYFEKHPVANIGTFLKIVLRMIPESFRDRPIEMAASGMVALASKASRPTRRKLSIVLPAFNEAATLRQVMDGVLAQELDELDKEIVLVESNSTDGTREIALEYQHLPQVKLVLEDRPSGKGHAVRSGLAAATGDFILIQDADSEYDMEDYHVLLEPLRNGQRAFILGARHGGKIWKLRQFKSNRLVSGFMNFGHWVFKTLVNVMFGLKLRDPFTMYKVFRRDCLSGLKLECNRFDLDYELVIKLVRKGYIPVEIPVNYRSRSFSEGKKVSMIRDPLTWLQALAKYRLQRLDLFEPADAIGRITNPDTVARPHSAGVPH